MFLSNTQLKQAIEGGHLIVDPPPPMGGYDPTSIDLHLDDIDSAKVWDVEAVASKDREHGNHDLGAIGIGNFQYKNFAGNYLIPVPHEPAKGPNHLEVYRSGNEIHIRKGGFMLWQTKEKVGTPEDNAKYILFVNAKSTKARTGIVVHFTAPTIEAAWNGKVTLEIANFGPFILKLRPGDAIAQITVAEISSPPDKNLRAKKSVTHGQTDPGT